MSNKIKQKIEITKPVADNYAKYMLKKHKARIVNTKSWWRKSGAKEFALKIGVEDKETADFFNNNTFVIGGKIYCSFWDKLSPEKKVFLIIHEIQHVIDQKSVGAAKFLMRYFADLNYRVEREQFAMLAEMEFAKWQLDVILQPSVLANRLRPYRVGNKGVGYCERLLTAYLPAVKRGVVTTQSGRDTIEFFKGL